MEATAALRNLELSARHKEIKKKVLVKQPPSRRSRATGPLTGSWSAWPTRPG